MYASPFLNILKIEEMQMDIAELYQKVFQTCVDFTVYRKKNIREHIEGLLPLLEEFSNVFLGKQDVEMDEEDYQYLQASWMDILEDLVSGLKEDDRVLLEDTVEYGLKVFLELFFEEQELQQLREACVIGQ